ncbi:putative glucan endo-1,3-beta-glucosidase [Fulvia fulva]|uniref:Glucan endo-1,3-beta-glucosidase n=1 Tax=Passalora fulva TaxID=5499 RepID=A0A9Q8P7U7_PASFU|nr:putative glucan endo-1,3-beta-glucosidase [Fulvia fulva]KAK4616015.1 putative glucan endo-1,3-beta-glucosidase [Fulvia fulva]KAK4616749.1 putative glucan endo-1,3-beta-glucosidase [Fulvia fulva]UJO16411.1 putative glucan endo-1,3-beta-glucosidase [Fulvia fulva]WPV19360.1 putative glucan endo-1,3-beta-glucosidase [Fulvia fulva]WPV34101.1 putative glucan endo-1,3-beta-glucosidase [Fulvia fulva]
MKRRSLLAIGGLISAATAQYVPPLTPGFKRRPPKPPPSYMVDNTDNTFGVAPDKGDMKAPAAHSAYFEALNTIVSDALGQVNVATELRQAGLRDDPDFWPNIVKHGQSPFVDNASQYTIFRNVKDYGARGDGVTDDTQAINDAIVNGARCGEGCGQSSALGAVIYFPPGEYQVLSPLVQYYYTQFVGDANN